MNIDIRNLFITGLAIGTLFLSGCETSSKPTPEQIAAFNAQRAAYKANPRSVFKPQLDMLVPQCLQAFDGKGVDKTELTNAGFRKLIAFGSEGYVLQKPGYALGVQLLSNQRSCTIGFYGDYVEWPQLKDTTQKVLTSLGYDAITDEKKHVQQFRKGTSRVSAKIRALSSSYFYSMEVIIRKE